jgi:hypothetical protein
MHLCQINSISLSHKTFFSFHLPAWFAQIDRQPGCPTKKAKRKGVHGWKCACLVIDVAIRTCHAVAKGRQGNASQRLRQRVMLDLKICFENKSTEITPPSHKKKKKNFFFS